MVTADGQVKLLDFGIAKATALETSFTDAGEIKGKYAYVSPEQVSGSPLDRRSDVFSAGVLLYMLTTGRHPFKGQSAAETVKKICSDAPSIPPTRLSDDFPPELERVLMKALQKSPDARFASAARRFGSGGCVAIFSARFTQYPVSVSACRMYSCRFTRRWSAFPAASTSRPWKAPSGWQNAP